MQEWADMLRDGSCCKERSLPTPLAQGTQCIRGSTLKPVHRKGLPVTEFAQP